MIVYNVNRRFFDKKEEAEAYRKAEGLRPYDTIKIAVDDRRQLAALLTELCEPTVGRPQPAMCATVGGNADTAGRLIDNAFVDGDKDIPLFLRKENARRFGHPEPTR